MRFSRLSLFVLIYIFFIILWGAFVRASGSGAGCGEHWPACNGEIIPLSASTETLIEYTHRVTSGLSMVFIFILYLWSRKKKEFIRRAGFWSQFFILTEAGFGAVLVLNAYVAEDSSFGRGIIMPIHQVNTLFLLLSLTVTWISSRWNLSFHMTKIGKIAFLWICGISALGAIAALGNTLFPSESLSEGLQKDFDTSSHPFVLLRTFHPFLAVSFVFWLSYLVWIREDVVQKSPWSNVISKVMMTLVWGQLVFGFSNMVMLAPIWMQIVHLFLSDLLLVSTIIALNEWRKVES